MATKIALKQIRPQPRFVFGYYQKIRVAVMYAILALFFISPWLRVGGVQAIQFNFTQGKISLFGLSLLPQDYFIFAFIFAIAAILLFMATVYAGRVWCGYACPQTIWTHLFQYIEKIIIGERGVRQKFYRAKLNPSKALKLFLVNAIWGIISFATAATFVMLAIGTDAFFSHFLAWSGLTWVFLAIFGIATYVNAGFMREHMCVYICPYGRFQSVMLDKDSLTVSYDPRRGEPRGKKSGGDCIDCTMCVQVCPTGIDIRDGLQAACIQCAACIDACDEIMDKIGKPRGLVGYLTERQLLGEPAPRKIRLRLIAYITILTLLTTGAIWQIKGKKPIEIDVRHDRRALTQTTRTGEIKNSYIIKITNKTKTPQQFSLSLDANGHNLRLDSRLKSVKLHPNESYDMAISITGRAPAGHTPIIIIVKNADGSVSGNAQNVFIHE